MINDFAINASFPNDFTCFYYTVTKRNGKENGHILKFVPYKF
ncbi:hypothetical protein K710_1435 [Streptococcus iniae SF1]|nr:hypothetical protein K710_1435 [Streptococcus iniae SF1]EKB51645.1 hypothetical protein A0G_1551 [Streptococcus iniae 9117]